MSRNVASVLVAVAALATSAVASAQEPTRSFEALAARLQIGRSIWVTNPAGRELHGRLEQLTDDQLILRTNRLITIAADDVRRIRVRDHDSVKNGTLIGLGTGVGLGTAWCIGAAADNSGDIDVSNECAEGFTVYPAIGALIGCLVDGIFPGQMRLIYEPSPPHDRSHATVRVEPSLSRHAKSVRVVLTF